MCAKRYKFEWGATLPHVQTRACHSAYDFAPHCCMHTAHSEKISHIASTPTCALLAANDSRLHTQSIISHVLAHSFGQPANIDWLLICVLAFSILNGSCFVPIHLVFRTPKLRESGQHNLHTPIDRTSNLFEEMYTICTHSTKLPAICI